MHSLVNLILSPRQASDQKYYTSQVARTLGVKEDDIALLRIVKRSVDARHAPLKVLLTIEAFTDEQELPQPIHFEYPDVSCATEVVVVGAGPAGLYAALRLIELGYKPLVFERGKDVVERGKDIAQIQRNNDVNPESNYAFGEGGAGTFSDGKLFTRSKKRGDYNRALQRLVFHGASEEILFEAHPHIGTDRLPRIISDMRRQIISSGGRVEFNSRVSGIAIKDGKARGVYVGDMLVEAAAVVVATGHSARDVYHMLFDSGVRLEAKPYAMGVRIEHPQSLINTIQYHNSPDMEYLPAASYSLVAQVGGRGVYSFCMCPGGFIVPAMTDSRESVVNGMSPSRRNSPYANSGFVTEIRLEDFAHLREKYGELAGLEYQSRLERIARENSMQRQVAPAQRVTDFVWGHDSKTLPHSSYVPGLTPSRLDRWMPELISSRLREAIKVFDRRMHGYLTDQAVVVGVESRTSTPVRIPRDRDTLQHPQVEGLYPSGEGAGYAGGIISAALDGERIAEAIDLYIRKK